MWADGTSTEHVQSGLAGCGPTIAQRIASRTDLGQKLFAAATTLHQDEAIAQFLVGWREELRFQLENDPNGLIGRHYKLLARRLNKDFPSITVLRQYVDPVTSGSSGFRLNSILWTPRCPDLARMAGLCETLFAWASEGNMQAKFTNIVWPGAIFRSLLQVSYHIPSLRS